MGLFRDDAAFAPGRERGVGQIDCGEEFGSGAFAVFPQCEGLLDGVALVVQATGFDCVPGRRLSGRGVS